MNIVMTIAGSDSGGGAGIQADLKTFQELKVFGTSAITALTAQNTCGVMDIAPADPYFIAKQMQVLFADFPIQAVKTGMLFSSQIIEIVANELKGKNVKLVIDPVMVAKGGASLLKEEAVRALVDHLIPLATVVTPNIPEVEVMTGIIIESEEDIERAAKKILAMGAKCVVMKGGHLQGDEAKDYVYMQNEHPFTLVSERIDSKHTHGTGCTFSAAITAFLGNGYSLKKAIIEAKKFIHLAISYAPQIGQGHGPTNHFAYNEHKEERIRVNVQ